MSNFYSLRVQANKELYPQYSLCYSVVKFCRKVLASPVGAKRRSRHPEEYHNERGKDATQDLQEKIDPVDHPLDPDKLEDRPEFSRCLEVPPIFRRDQKTV